MNIEKIYIIGEIGIDTTFNDVFKQIDNISKDVDLVRFYIDSYGGNIFEGVKIYDLIKNLSIDTHTIALTNCDSIATRIFMAGDRKTILSDVNESFVIHDASINLAVLNNVTVNADDLDSLAKELKEEEDKITTFYAENTKLSFDEADKLMNEETNLSHAQLLDFGFADEVIISDELNNVLELKNLKNLINNKYMGIFERLEKRLKNMTEEEEKEISNVTEEVEKETSNMESEEKEETTTEEKGVSREEFDKISNELSEMKQSVQAIVDALSEDSLNSMIGNKMKPIEDQALKVLEFMKNQTNNFTIPTTNSTNQNTEVAEKSESEKMLDIHNELKNKK
jgi:ATP-dependent Clp protease protease subunit